MKYGIITAAALALTALPGSASAACAGRTVKHAMGTSCVPTNPKRVVVLDTGPLDTALLVGIKPIGATTLRSGEVPAYLGKEVPNIASVGGIAEPNLEKIAALKPDLILSSKLRHGKVYNQLSKIAPTVMTEEIGVTWRSDALLWGRALGEEREVQRALSLYKQRAAALGRRLPNRTVGILRFTGPHIRSMNRANFIGTVLDDAGIDRPKFQQPYDFASLISLEGVPQFKNSNYIFYTVYGDKKGSAENYQEVTSSPFWKTLPAVQRGNAVQVPDDYWMTGLGIKAANMVLDDLEKTLQ